MCCKTKSQKNRKGFISSLMGGDPDRIHHTAMLIPPATQICASNEDKSGTVVASARLMDIQVKDFESDLIEDNGIEVCGFVGGSIEHVQEFIG